MSAAEPRHYAAAWACYWILAGAGVLANPPPGVDPGQIEEEVAAGLVQSEHRHRFDGDPDFYKVIVRELYDTLAGSGLLFEFPDAHTRATTLQRLETALRGTLERSVILIP